MSGHVRRVRVEMTGGIRGVRGRWLMGGVVGVSER